MAGAGEEEKSRRNMMVSSSSTTGFCYSDITTTTSTNPNIHHTHLLNQHHQIQNSFDDSDHSNNNPPENFFNLTTGGGGGSMDEMINPPPPPPPPPAASAWKGFFNNKHHDLMTHQSTAAASNWHHQQNDEDEDEDDDASLMRCVFSCEGNERPSQGLSLSLSSTNPSTIGLQSFELRRINTATTTSTTTDDHHPFLYSSNQQQHHQQISNQFFQLRNSKFLSPAQQLLNEFCGIGNNQISSSDDPSSSQYKNKNRNKNKKNTNHHQQEEGTSTSSRNLHSLELIELQKRKAKLLSMLEEVDRRYKHYCDQMKAVVSSFESVAGNGAATVYSALASKAMSRHFRCLRDGIVGQIQDMKKAMGEKDPMVVVAPGTTKGETPRLRLLDQTLRQQRALQQMTMMETHPWRPQRGLPERSVSVLRAWLFEHFLHPYPSDVDKHILARQTGLSRSQVSNWFINARVRLWKPMVEEMYLEETKEHHHQRLDDDNNNMASLLFDGATATTTTTTTGGGGGGGGLVLDDDDCLLHPQNQNPQDQKPTHDQLVRIDSECLSSIISPNLEKTEDKDGKTLPNHHYHQSFGRVGSSTDTYGAMELDFSSYNHHNAVTYQNFVGGVGGSGGGVSLTLGLQQHGGNGGGGGVNLAFSSAASAQNSLFYSRDHHIDDCQPVVQYSMLDGEGQNLPYRNLLGAQLLHDLAG